MIFAVRLRAADNERKKGRYDKAAKDLDHAVNEARQPGAALQDLALSLLLRGVNYRDWANTGARDKFGFAEQDYLELLRVKATLGASGDVLNTKRLLGTLYVDWGSSAPNKLTEAERWLSEWLEESENGTPERAQVLFTLALALSAHGRRSEAEEPLTQALAITDATEGEDSIGSAVLHHELGNFYWAEKRFDFAVQHLQQAVQIMELIHGQADPHLEPTLAALGAVYKEMGEHDKGDEALHRAVAIGKQIKR